MHDLYIELLTMTGQNSQSRNPEHATAAIKTAAIESAPEPFRRKMEEKTRLDILPALPAGQTFARGTFWSDFRAKFIWHRAWLGDTLQKDNGAKWLREQREAAQRRSTAWPPAPVFMAHRVQPMPWDGKNEQPGRVPRG